MCLKRLFVDCCLGYELIARPSFSFPLPDVSSYLSLLGTGFSNNTALPALLCLYVAKEALLIFLFKSNQNFTISSKIASKFHPVPEKTLPKQRWKKSLIILMKMMFHILGFILFPTGTDTATKWVIVSMLLKLPRLHLFPVRDFLLWFEIMTAPIRAVPFAALSINLSQGNHCGRFDSPQGPSINSGVSPKYKLSCFDQQFHNSNCWANSYLSKNANYALPSSKLTYVDCIDPLYIGRVVSDSLINWIGLWVGQPLRGNFETVTVMGLL